MKKACLLMLMLVSLTYTNLFACGCLDPSTAQSGARDIINNYNQADTSLTKSLEKFFTEVTYHYDTQAYDLNEMKKSLQLLLDEAMSVKEDLFSTDNQVDLR